MAEVYPDDFRVVSCTQLALLLGLIPVSIYLFKKLFPNQYKKLRSKTIIAWVTEKVMRKVHAKCTEPKTELFRNFKDLKCDGRVPHILEVGVGPGLNIPLLPKQCTLSCLDPNPEFQQYIMRLLKQYPGIKMDKFAKGFAEDMGEFDDNTFDAVIVTFTLCTVRQPRKAISEIKRVLKPGGFFFFLEHVAASRPSTLRTVQEWMNLIWPFVSEGCSLVCETGKSIEEAGFTTVQQKHIKMNLFPVLSSGLSGVAIK